MNGPDLARDGALRVSDAAALLGVGRTTIYELLRAGHLVGARIGGRRVVLRASCIALLAAAAELERATA